MRKLFSALGLIFLSTLTAQQTVRPDFDTITVTFDCWETPYLHQAAATDTSRERYSAAMAGNALSFAGHARTATKFMESRIGKRTMDTTRYQRFATDFKPEGAQKSLLRSASDHEIVIINEAHHEPRHRVFTRSMLQGLYDLGYRHFGLESVVKPQFVPVDSLLKAGNRFTLNHGYYTRDPQFAELVNEASRIGFSIFGYDQSGTGSPKLRELGQMRNIMDYRADNADGKLLLHVGYSHAKEGELGGRWDKAMAQRLADTTNLDPLTIDQTYYREMSDPVQEQFEYKNVPVSQPSVFVNNDGEHWNYDNKTNWFDRYVFHPRTQYRHGRPDYVYAYGQQPVVIDFSTIGQPGPYLVQAYGIKDDMVKAVPYDVIETTGTDKMAIALPEGKYRLIVTLPGGEQFVGKINVADGK